MDRRNYSNGTDWDPAIGRAQIVRLGSHIFISGTIGISDFGHIVGPGDAYAQASQALRNIEVALQHVGAHREHITRTRMFISNTNISESVAKAHADFFGKCRPVNTIVESTSLPPDALVQIEAEAVLS